MASHDSVRWFSDIRLRDVPAVGGKNASLGELYSVLSDQGIQVPNGFARRLNPTAPRCPPPEHGTDCISF